MGHNPFWSRIQNFKIIFSNIFVHTSATTSYIHSEIFWSDTIIYQGRRKVWKSGFFSSCLFMLCFISQYMVSIFESPTFWLSIFGISNIFPDYNFKVSLNMCKSLKIWFGQLFKTYFWLKRPCSSSFSLLRYLFFPSCLFMLCVSTSHKIHFWNKNVS